MLAHNVLVVEDDETVRRLLVEYLQGRASAEVDGARDGVEALHQVAVKRYTVVVLDVLMPKMSGIDFLDSLQALVFDPSVQSLDEPPAVLVITSTPPGDLPDATLEHRFPQLVRGIFRKPLDIRALGAAVERVLGE